MKDESVPVVATCISVSSHGDALRRGKQYLVLAHDEQKRQVKIRGENGRTRWYPAYCFDLEGGPAPVLVAWQLDDEIVDEESGWIEVSFSLDNGERRWCAFTTPQFLQKLLDKEWETGINEAHMIVVKRLQESLFGEILRALDQDGKLYAASLPLQPGDSEEADEEAAEIPSLQEFPPTWHEANVNE